MPRYFKNAYHSRYLRVGWFGCDISKDANSLRDSRFGLLRDDYFTRAIVLLHNFQISS